uniref:BTB domain-containing protein n=1 Tax=Panagrolaimus sp. JU765 TaxID=591449 RepID=A0AC34RM37_9BILA
MVLEIVQKSHFIVPADSLGENKPFSSGHEQISVLNGYLFHINCQEKDENIGIYLHMVIPKPVTISCTFTVNSITRNHVHIFNKSEGFGFPKFGKKSSLDDEKSKDCAICVEDKEINVHKNIIAIASPVFAAMLKPHCKEFKEGRVDIKDFDFETIKAGVKLMYTRKNPDELSLNSLLNLYKFADKYDLIDTETVFEKLMEKICLETILEISKFSKANSMDKLYEVCGFLCRVF